MLTILSPTVLLLRTGPQRYWYFNKILKLCVFKVIYDINIDLKYNSNLDNYI